MTETTHNTDGENKPHVTSPQSVTITVECIPIAKIVFLFLGLKKQQPHPPTHTFLIYTPKNSKMTFVLAVFCMQ